MKRPFIYSVPARKRCALPARPTRPIGLREKLMKCPRCSAETTAAHRFCTRCGDPLPQTCAACGTLNEPSARFCGQCGMGWCGRFKQRLRDGEAAGPQTVPQAAERRHLTVAFYDMAADGARGCSIGDLREVIRGLGRVRPGDRTVRRLCREVHGRRRAGLFRLSEGLRTMPNAPSERG